MFEHGRRRQKHDKQVAKGVVGTVKEISPDGFIKVEFIVDHERKPKTITTTLHLKAISLVKGTAVRSGNEQAGKDSSGRGHLQSLGGTSIVVMPYPPENPHVDASLQLAPQKGNIQVLMHPFQQRPVQFRIMIQSATMNGLARKPTRSTAIAAPLQLWSNGPCEQR